MNTNFFTQHSYYMPSPEALRREALKEVFWAPVTWVPFVPAMGMVALAPLPLWANVVTLSVPALFVAGTWSYYWPRLLKAMEARLLEQNSKTADQAIEEILNKLVQAGLRQEELFLAKAEEIIHTMTELNTGQPSEQSIRIEAVAREVFTQMMAEAQTAIHGVEKHELVDYQAIRVSLCSSLETLQQSLHTIEQQARLLDKISHQKPGDRLAELRSQLQQENTIARNVLSRLENDSPQL
ncbi:MAG: hypothetical protein ACAI35_16950 [Candidatus Methylacidiphilales bacterium]|nr:hypothetical protein [Candidatus Methylacidiphilales bacterium]